MTEMYDWQDRLYELWKAQNYVGLCKAPTGAGKTIAGVITLKRYIAEHPEHEPLILTPSANVGRSWSAELERHGMTDIPIMTYQTAVNAMERNNLKCDVMICDECHRLGTPVQGRVMELLPRAVLGLSATPETAKEILGDPLMDISIHDANICPFSIHYVTFAPTASEVQQYADASQRMEKRALQASEGRQRWLKPGQDSVGWNSYDALSRKRREVCYLMPSRMGHVLRIIKTNIGRRMIVYFERTAQVHELQKLLWDDRIRSAIHVQDESTLDEFENGRCNILIACKSLREGYNDPSISCIIMGSINTRAIINTQTIGRALRIDPEDPDKHADIYMLMAEGTTDTKVEKSLDYPKDVIIHERIENIGQYKKIGCRRAGSQRGNPQGIREGPVEAGEGPRSERIGPPCGRGSPDTDAVGFVQAVPFQHHADGRGFRFRGRKGPCAVRERVPNRGVFAGGFLRADVLGEVRQGDRRLIHAYGVGSAHQVQESELPCGVRDVGEVHASRMSRLSYAYSAGRDDSGRLL